MEIDRDMFVEEVNFLVKVSEINMADEYNRLLVAAAERLNIIRKPE